MKNDFKIHFDTLVMFRIDFGLQKYILNGFWTDFVNFFKIKKYFYQPLLYRFPHKSPRGSYKTVFKFFLIFFDFLTPNRVLVMKNVFKTHFDTRDMFRIRFGSQKYILNVFWTRFGDFLKK